MCCRRRRRRRPLPSAVVVAVLLLLSPSVKIYGNLWGWFNSQGVSLPFLSTVPRFIGLPFSTLTTRCTGMDLDDQFPTDPLAFFIHLSHGCRLALSHAAGVVCSLLSLSPRLLSLLSCILPLLAFISNHIVIPPSSCHLVMGRLGVNYYTTDTTLTLAQLFSYTSSGRP